MKQYKIISLLKIIQRCTLIFTFSSAQTLPRDVSSSKYVRIFIPTFAHSLSPYGTIFSLSPRKVQRYSYDTFVRKIQLKHWMTHDPFFNILISSSQVFRCYIYIRISDIQNLVTHYKRSHQISIFISNYKFPFLLEYSKNYTYLRRVYYLKELSTLSICVTLHFHPSCSRFVIRTCHLVFLFVHKVPGRCR